MKEMDFAFLMSFLILLGWTIINLILLYKSQKKQRQIDKQLGITY